MGLSSKAELSHALILFIAKSGVLLQITHFINIVELNASAPCTTAGNVANTHYNEVIQGLVKLPIQLLLLYIPSFTLQVPENPLSLVKEEPCAEDPKHPAFHAARSERMDGPIIRHKVVKITAKVVILSQNPKLGICVYFVLYLIRTMSFQHSLV